MRGSKLAAAAALCAIVAGCAKEAPKLAEALPPPPAMAAEAAIVVTAQRRAAQNYDSAVAVTAVSSAYIPAVQAATDPGNERYDGKEVSPVKVVATEPVSTFAVDVDTGAYANARRFLTQGMLPPQDAVRTEEMINYFRYDYAAPEDRSQPFTVTTDVAKSPWNPDAYLMRVGLRGYDIAAAERPPANLVFLMDVSGSMNSPDKLPLVKTALAGLRASWGRRTACRSSSMPARRDSCLNRPAIRQRSSARSTSFPQGAPPPGAQASNSPIPSRKAASSRAASTA